ncbi:uncharacterized protein RAG0_00748 [Rhynchosporium agropyri]|uniref:Uncharacterized protein n=1 Tax=Rhynchosporium agropyri TaxID=914238 RepID=A0A1E1JYJ5_9HELO|nr:uncharacterized protein RAG0_00748 [Rhynchosporium agropyri]
MAGVMRGNYEKEIAYATDRAVQGLPSATAKSTSRCWLKRAISMEFIAEP